MVFSGVVNSRYPSQRRRLGTERDSAIYHAITNLVGDLKSELAKFDWQRVRVILGKMDISWVNLYAPIETNFVQH